MQWPLNRQDILGLFEHYHVQPTKQRIDIAQIMFARPQHLSADQVLNTVNASQPTVSKATVYNTLGLFAQKGLIREVIVDPSRVFYDSNISQHHHIYNIDTGELTDIPAAELAFTGLPEIDPANEIAGIDVIVRVRNASS